MQLVVSVDHIPLSLSAGRVSHCLQIVAISELGERGYLGPFLTVY